MTGSASSPFSMIFRRAAAARQDFLHTVTGTNARNITFMSSGQRETATANAARNEPCVGSKFQADQLRISLCVRRRQHWHCIAQDDKGVENSMTTKIET